MAKIVCHGPPGRGCTPCHTGPCSGGGAAAGGELVRRQREQGKCAHDPLSWFLREGTDGEVRVSGGQFE